MSLVSVVLPTRNRSHLLARAVHSVLAQSYENLELIVVDDGSTDGTPRAMADIADPRVRYLRNDRPMGAAAARNRGISAAGGVYVAFHDDDDIWLIERLEKQLADLQRTGEDVALSLCGHFCLEASGPRYVGGHWAFSGIDFTKGTTGEWALIATPGWLLRRAVLESVGGFDERIQVWHDWDLALRLSSVGQIVHFDEPLFIQDRVRGTALVRDLRAIANDLKIIVNKHGAAQQWSSSVVSNHYFAIGRFSCAAGALHEGRGGLWRSIAANWFNFPAWVVLLVSILGSDAVRWLTALGRRSRQLVARAKTG